MTEYDGLVKTVINIKNTGTGDLVKKTPTIRQKLMKLKGTLLVMIMINILLLKGLIN